MANTKKAKRIRKNNTRKNIRNNKSKKTRVKRGGGNKTQKRTSIRLPLLLSPIKSLVKKLQGSRRKKSRINTRSLFENSNINPEGWARKIKNLEQKHSNAIESHYRVNIGKPTKLEEERIIRLMNHTPITKPEALSEMLRLKPRRLRTHPFSREISPLAKGTYATPTYTSQTNFNFNKMKQLNRKKAAINNKISNLNRQMKLMQFDEHGNHRRVLDISATGEIIFGSTNPKIENQSKQIGRNAVHKIQEGFMRNYKLQSKAIQSNINKIYKKYNSTSA